MSEFLKKESALLGERYHTAYHKSGLPVIVFPKKMSTTYAMLAVRFGSIDNTTGQGDATFPDGVAHFLEHKLFANEDGSDSFERFSALGADANAYTAYSRTVYLFSCTDHFEQALAELLRFVSHPWFTEASVSKERGIIGEEIKMCRDDPYDRCYQNMLRGLYEKHPARINICGSEQSIANITPQILYDAYRTYYTPSNMALIVCGDVTPEQVMTIADAELKDFGGAPAPKYQAVSEKPIAAAPSTVAHGQVAKPIFVIGIKDVCIPASPEARTRRGSAMDILSEMLFSETGELYNRLHDAGLLSPEISFGYAQTRDVGFLRLSGESDEPETVQKEIFAYLEEVRKTGLSREDFEHCRRIEFAEYIKSFDSTEEIAENLVDNFFDGADLFSLGEVIQSITFEEVTALFEEFFDPARATLSVVLPNQK